MTRLRPNVGMPGAHGAAENGSSMIRAFTGGRELSTTLKAAETAGMTQTDVPTTRKLEIESERSTIVAHLLWE